MVELRDPVLAGNDLSYQVKVLEGALAASVGVASLFPGTYAATRPLEKRFGVMLIAAIAAIGVSELGERLSVPGIHSLIPTAEGIVGRPLTPVSVAGVGRRTVRRCAVGVYKC